MATGLAATLANALVDAICSATALTEPPEFWVKLHTGSPGGAGTSNAATETTRKQATFAAASAGRADTSADLEWLNVAATETYSYISFWDDETAGNFLGSDALNTSRDVTAGDNFTIAAGDASVSLSPLAA